jgi:hypothetical protein
VSDVPASPELSTAVPEPARAFTRELIAAGGGHLRAVILYGSQLHRSSPNLHSAWDLVVVTDGYRDFHRAFHDAGYQSRNKVVMDVMGYVLPPYVTDFAPSAVEGIAKCLVLSKRHLRTALSRRSSDHFLKGRLVQHVEIVWAASPDDALEIEDAMAGARDRVLDWAGPFLEEPFDASSLTQTMLAVSFGGELRPESSGRYMEVWESQAQWLVSDFERVLDRAEAAGRIVRAEPGGYRFVRTRGALDRLRVRAYFLWSKIRGTTRWLKHIVTFNDWLTYIQRKTERRTGLEIHLTPAERKYPLLLLWPKVIRVLRHSGPGEDDGTQQLK